MNYYNGLVKCDTGNMLVQNGSDDGGWHTELLWFWTSTIVRNFR
jgi:hypothetical protein